MRNAIALLAVMVVLTACGVDGEPIRPTAAVGVSVTPNGVYPSAGLGASTGPLSLWLGL
ncbi:MAG: hypothetical protein ABJI96_07855 [Paracoccaceae bacterium]